ncbi:MAG: hypothetical protein ACI4RV_02395 [Eubacteriales bacterium]
MFDNIGAKIKAVAKVVTAIGIFLSILWGIVVMGLGQLDEIALLVGFAIAAIGSLLSWLSCLMLYGLGQLIENTDILVQQGKNKQAKSLGNESLTIVPGNDAHVWRCVKCGQMIDHYPCRFCGEVNSQKTDIPYKCAKCGREGPFPDGVYCPECGSTMKIMNYS